MKHSVILAGVSLVTLAFLVGCSSPNGDSDDGGEGGGEGGTAGTGTGGIGAGGASGNAGTGGTAGGGAMCSNSNRLTLPIDESGWVAAECNDLGIQGAFYCYDDGVNPTSCPPAAADGTRPPPFRAGGGMCISGNTTMDPTYAAWGAGIGLSLGDSGGTPSVKTAYDATANGVTGFDIDMTGSTGNRPLRIGFTGSATPMGAQPFVEFPAGAMALDVPIADALVPSTWTTDPNAGTMANPSSIFD